MAKCKYTWEIVLHKSVRILCLVDSNVGMSLTNNIEEVVEELKKELPAFPSKIIYKDNEGNWDGWSDAKQQFILLFADNKKQALNEIITR